MLYMIGKTFLHGVSFGIVHDESVHENMKKKIEKEMEVCEKALSSCTHIYQIRAFKFRLMEYETIDQ